MLTSVAQVQVGCRAPVPEVQVPASQRAGDAHLQVPLAVTRAGQLGRPGPCPDPPRHVQPAAGPDRAGFADQPAGRTSPPPASGPVITGVPLGLGEAGEGTGVQSRRRA